MSAAISNFKLIFKLKNKVVEARYVEKLRCSIETYTYVCIIHHQAILLDRMQFEKYVTDKNTDCLKYCAANAILRCMIINIYHWV